MDFALVYVVHRFFFRIADFFYHWYVHGSRNFRAICSRVIANLERTFAVRVTLRHFFEPLYGDYSIIGRTLGFVFRVFRLAVGAAVYAVIAALFAGAYAVWLAVPPYLLIHAWGTL